MNNDLLADERAGVSRQARYVFLAALLVINTAIATNLLV